MVEIPDSLRSLFSATVEEEDGTYVVEVPSEEIDQEALTADTTYQVAILNSSSPKPSSPQKSQIIHSQQDVSQSSGPPVDEGEVRSVTIETVGEEGDGITKVERGYVVIVPGGQLGGEPTVESIKFGTTSRLPASSILTVGTLTDSTSTKASDL